MSTMQRMAPGIFGGDLAMYPSDDGKYVRLDDALAAIQAARALGHAVPAIPEGALSLLRSLCDPHMYPRLLPLLEWIDGLSAAPPPPAGQQDRGEPECELCPKCGGSGETTVLSDNGPDAYDVPVCCPHCDGAETLVAAYDGVVKLLRTEEKKYRECSAIIWRYGKSKGDAVTQLRTLGEYIGKEGADVNWVRDRLLALADMADTIPATASEATAAQQDSYREGVNIDRLSSALLFLGIAGCGQEEMAARMSDYVNQMTLGVMRLKDSLSQATQPAAHEELSSACLDCGGTGIRDSGGFQPWGEAIMMPCDCGANQAFKQAPLNERQIMKCIADAGCYGTVKMSFESGPYSVDRPSLNADKLVRAIEKAHGIAAPANGEVKS